MLLLLLLLLMLLLMLLLLLLLLLLFWGVSKQIDAGLTPSSRVCSPCEPAQSCCSLPSTRSNCTFDECEQMGSGLLGYLIASPHDDVSG